MKTLKRILYPLILTLIFTFITPVFFHGEAVTVNAATVKLNSTSKKMYIDDTYTLKVTGTKKHIMWSSSNKKIATVSSKGKITAKKAGDVTITATVGTGASRIKLKCNVTVNSRLSTKENIIRCYPGEYEQIKIKTKSLKSGYTLGAELDKNSLATISLKKKSGYYNVIIEPKSLGYSRLTIRLYQQSGFSIAPKKDSINLTVISYPDKSGWIEGSKLKNYGVSCMYIAEGLYYLSQGSSSSSLTGITSGGIYLSIYDDDEVGKNIYKANGLRYKIKSNKIYIHTKDFEKKYL